MNKSQLNLLCANVDDATQTVILFFALRYCNHNSSQTTDGEKLENREKHAHLITYFDEEKDGRTRDLICTSVNNIEPVLITAGWLILFLSLFCFLRISTAQLSTHFFRSMPIEE